MKGLSKVFIFSLLLAFSISLAHAQTIPTGKLDGYVNDIDDMALPGASVMINSPSLITPQMNCVSNEKGYYRFIGIPSGIYKVTFEMPGFKTVIREGIGVTAGRSTTLSIILKQSTIEETVLVKGEAPTVDVQNTATGATFGKETLQDLPVGRSVNAVANLAPGMYNQTSHGSDQLTNRYSIDGLNQSHPLHGVLINEVGFSSIEEITVETGMHKAEFGGVKGAVIQVITKSGGNNFSGDATVYLQQKSFQSDNTKGTPFEGKFIGFDYEYQPNFTLGGPVKREKAWFFISLDTRIYRDYVQGYPYNSEQHQAIDRPWYRPFGKLTWQIGPKDKLTTSLHYSYTTNNHGGANRYMTIDTTTKAPEWGITASSQWTRVFSEKLLFNARVGYFYNFGNRILKNDNQRVRETRTGEYTGSGGYYHENKRGRWQFSTDSTYFVEDWHGSHELKVGSEMEFSWNGSHRTWVQDPRWEGVFGPTFKVSRQDMRDGLPYRLAVTENYHRKEQALNIGLFIQDTWALSKKLVLSLGVRYDFSQSLWPRQKKVDTDTWLYEKTVVVMTWNTLSPRLGIIFDPFDDGKTVLKASYGRYYCSLMTMFANRAHGATPHSFSVSLNTDWTENYRYGFSAGLGEVDPDGVSPYYNDEINFGVERELIKNLSLSVMYIQKWEKNWIKAIDKVHVDIPYLKEHGLDNGNVRWIGYNLVEGTDPLTGNTVTFYSMDPSYPTDIIRQITNVPGLMRKYRGLEIKLYKRMSNNWGMFASFIWGRGEGLLGTNRSDTDAGTTFFYDPNQHINAWGTLKHQKECVFKCQGTYMAPLGIQLSAQYILASGEPYPRQLRSSEAGTKLYQGNVTILVEPYGTYYYPTTHELNLRVQKAFNLGGGKLTVIGDVFRVLNAQTTTSVGWRTGVDWQNVTSIMNPRYFRLGLSYRF